MIRLGIHVVDTDRVDLETSDNLSRCRGTYARESLHDNRIAETDAGVAQHVRR